MRRYVAAGLGTAILVITLIITLPAFASETPCKKGCGRGLIDVFNMSIDYMMPQYESSLQVLQGKDRDQWSEKEITDYLTYATIMVYYAQNLYLLHNRDQHLTNPGDLALQGFIDPWPVNPFNEWQPMEVRDASEGFHAGDIAIQICPMAYSTSGTCVSFHLFAFGPSEDWPGAKASIDDPLNQDPWIVLPRGAVYAIGMHTETDAERADRMRALSSSK
jgi:hypothetical protein